MTTEVKLLCIPCKKNIAIILSSYTAYYPRIIAHSPRANLGPLGTPCNTPRDIYSSYCLILIEHSLLQDNALTVWPLGESSTCTGYEPK